jgi:CheY-like chemotaxis protein
MPEEIRILVVEDDDAVRRLSVRMLKLLGVQTLEAGNGAEALHHVERTNHLSAVLMDLHLPDIEGTALAEWIRQRFPEIPIIFFTGANVGSSFLPETTASHTHWLKKPFTKESMSQVLHAALAVGAHPAQG